MYGKIAYVYDRLNEEIDHEKIADFIEARFAEYRIAPGKILDLGCGTGVFCLAMHKRGYRMTGADISLDMLACAKERAVGAEAAIEFIRQDASELKLSEPVDAAVSLIDVLNHVTDPRKLEKVFLQVSKNMIPGGLFIFDLNTRHKLENIMGGNVFYNIDNDVACIWHCSFKAGISVSDITLFIRKGDLFERYDGRIRERAYDDAQIRGFAGKAGFEVLKVYDGENFGKPRKKSGRVIYVCRKEK